VAFILVIALIILGMAVALVVFRRRRVALPVPVETEPQDDSATRAARHQVVEQRGAELLERRVDLDSRRGTLTGDSAIYDAFDRLEHKYRAGEISEDEFEAGKIEILGG
jgi:hypothetical protein